eukprot:6821840-Prymnesium_polylepis.1
MSGRGGVCVGGCAEGCTGLGPAPAGAFTLMFTLMVHIIELVRVASAVSKGAAGGAVRHSRGRCAGSVRGCGVP